MNIFTVIKKSASAIAFIGMVIGIFWLMQKKVTDNIMYCTLISIMVAIALTYFQSRFIVDVLEHSELIKNTKLEANSLRAQHKRWRKRFRSLCRNLRPLI